MRFTNFGGGIFGLNDGMPGGGPIPISKFLRLYSLRSAVITCSPHITVDKVVYFSTVNHKNLNCVFFRFFSPSVHHSPHMHSWRALHGSSRLSPSELIQTQIQFNDPVLTDMMWFTATEINPRWSGYEHRGEQSQLQLPIYCKQNQVLIYF